eukprot:12957927-Alexandrium_andersonii.AAC.1
MERSVQQYGDRCSLAAWQRPRSFAQRLGLPGSGENSEVSPSANQSNDMKRAHEARICKCKTSFAESTHAQRAQAQ